MSIIRTMTTGASGMRAESEALTAVSDNIANVNTIGFKRERAVFQDILGRSVMGSSAMAEGGAGSRVSQIQHMWTQGSLVTTGNPTDLALSGDGLFILRGNVGGADGQFYSRNGQFHVDSDGYVVNSDGLRLEGYTADDTGAIGTQLGDLRVDGMTLPANPTTNVTLHANLDARAPVGAVPFDPTDPGNTSQYSSPLTIVDSLGNTHQATAYFHNDGSGQWTWNVMSDGVVGATGTMQFGTDGSLTSATTSSSSFSFAGATSPQSVAFDFGAGTGGGGTGFEGMTQLGQASSVTELSQDGFGGGTVAGIHVEQDGTVTGTFSNGDHRALGQVAVARFASDDGLARSGQNLWQETTASGEPLVGAAGSGGRGAIVSGSLESSNVDLGQEFVDLIAFQRGFSANSKIISTADEMYQELVALKR